MTKKPATARILVLGLLALVSWSGALAQDADVRTRADAASAAYPGNFSFFYVPSSGLVADETFVVTSKARGPSKMAKQLASVFKRSSSSPLAIAISGPSESKTRQVVADALKVVSEKRLENLEVIYVGEKSSADALEPVVAALGAKFYFAAFQEASNKAMEPTR